ncbi:MAG: M15 family metallopeptidase, partial [Propionibacteriaceae bacterium]|nr:M15 family metallopeptidase [Propionibacteriaceae bacterium]
EELVEPTEELRVASAVEANAVAPAAAAVTLTSVQHPDFPSGSLFDRLGAIEVQGSAPGGTEGAAVTVQLTDANGTVRSTAATKLTTGRFIVLLDGGFSGPARLTATVAGAGEATSDVTLHRAGVTLTGATRIDPLGTSTIAGKVNPGIGDVLVEAHVAAGGGWVKAGAGRTTSDGSYQLTYAHGKGTIGTSQVRVCAILPWGATIPSSSSMTIERPRIANAVVTNTTAAEVASTYRAGCPVGPNNLSTIRINQQSIDGRVYRGELIVRRDRAAEVADVFTRTFAAGFPVFQMTNPNAFGADDIKMMAANNTSGFNCRRVVGNPYAMSPHSYGYAVDLNPLQNPYRDPSGKWHPSTNHVSRTPVVPGMLTATSAPVVAFKAHGWSWFSGWDWHHFEKK